MRSWYNAEPNTFMRLNDAERALSLCARQVDTHCHSSWVRRA